MSSREQVRAAKAFATIRNSGQDGAALRSLALQLPTMLMTNGFLATAAFLLAKGGSHHMVLFRALVSHLEGTDTLPPNQPPADDRARFRTWVGAQGLSGSALRRVTKESLALAVWLKRAAQAYEVA
jgi:CRISPR/Cas system CMR-associated protein Cmr5 small subunit